MPERDLPGPEGGSIPPTPTLTVHFKAVPIRMMDAIAQAEETEESFYKPVLETGIIDDWHDVQWWRDYHEALEALG